MSSAGQAVGGIVGGVIGFFIGGGPQGALYGAQLGMMVGGYIDPPPGPVINGPRLDDLSVQTSTYGAFIPRNYGTIAQHGNIFWLQGNALTETPQTTESGGKGGPTATTNTWEYSATFAVGLCQGPIDGIRRIWIAGQLWYDAGSDDLSTIISSNQKSSLFTLYLGTDTQTADPLMQADKGAANVSAHRGLAYIVFNNLPLANYGNSLMTAQVKCEIVKDGAITGLTYSGSDSLASGRGNYASSTYKDANGIYVWQVADSWSSGASTSVTCYLFPLVSDPVLLFTLPVTLSHTASSVDYVCQGKSDQNIFCVPNKTPGAYGITLIEPDGTVTKIPATVSSNDPTRYYAIKNGIVYFQAGAGALASMNFAVISTAKLSGTASSIALPWAMPTGQYIQNVMIVGNELVIAAKKSSDSKTYFIRYDLETLAYIAEIDIVAVFGDINVAFSSDSDGDYFYWIDTGILKRRIGMTGTDEDVGEFTAANGGGLEWESESTVYINSIYPDSENVIDCWYSYFDGVSHAYRLGTWTSNKITSNTVPLGDIVEAECLGSGLLELADIDVSELTDSVRGYRVTQLGAIRGAIDPLRAAWPFDVVQHGYQIKFKRRGSASVATIDASELDARAAGEAPGVQITDSREMDIMLPRRVSLSYVDAVREYDNNMQPAERINTDAVSDRAVELPIVLNADEAAQKAETLLYLYWLERYDIAFRLPPTYAHMEPGDVISITSDSADYEIRLTKTNTLPDGRIECAGKYNAAAIYTSTAVGEEGQSTGALLTLAGPSALQLLDIPLLRDDDDTAGFPVAMSGYLTGWPGGVLYRSDDSGQSWSDLQAFAPGAVIGYATSSLSTHGGTMYDLASTLSVRLYSGSLASVTETQLFAGQNWFAYGTDGRWEIIAARVATLQGDGSYVLMDFLRGQYGTEWATGLHVANDSIVLLDTAALHFVSVNASSIGTARDYRAITVGQSLDSAATQSFTYAGVNLECLSPVNLRGDRDPPTAKWTLYWNRRSRFGGWRDYVDTVLGEASESYEIDVFSDGTYTTLKRTLTSATETVEYSSAHQVTDFGSNQSTLYLKLYQLSATVGRGYPLTTSITRT